MGFKSVFKELMHTVKQNPTPKVAKPCCNITFSIEKNDNDRWYHEPVISKLCLLHSY
jgi:hypothetical protein